jgi:beta-N-acetylhexosaminidase
MVIVRLQRAKEVCGMRIARLAIAATAAVLVVFAAVGAATATNGGARASAEQTHHAIGQRIVSAMAGLRPSPALLRRVRHGEVGGVILFGQNVGSHPQVRAAIASLQRAARRDGNPPLLISTDQEGGTVRRFPSLPPSRSPARMGKSASLAEREGGRTGRALRAVGVNVNLAPVGDVPHLRGHFLGSRAFARDVQTAAAASAAFAHGLETAGVAATAKHFPGLGFAGTNTDLARVRIGVSEARLRADYPPFAKMAADKVSLVMLSNAAYPALDPSGRPACMSRRIVTEELRGAVGFAGVTISDALSTPAVRAVPDPYVKVANAGTDMLLFSSETRSAAAFTRLVAAARSGALDRDQTIDSAARIRALKASRSR